MIVMFAMACSQYVTAAVGSEIQKLQLPKTDNLTETPIQVWYNAAL